MIRNIITVVLLAGCAIIQAANAQSNRVSGQFNFPPGFTANQGEVKFKVSTDPLSTITVDDVEQETSAIVTIERFARFSTYSIVLKDGPPSTGPLPSFEDFQLNFECISGCANNFFLTTVGYWDSALGVVDKNQAEVFLGNTEEPGLTVNIELDRADVFSGAVRMPEGVPATGDEQIELLLVGSALGDKPEFRQTISTVKDQTEFEFRIGVPRLTNIGGWNIELRCTQCGSNIVSDTLYPTTASGDPISLVQSDGFLYRKFNSFSNIGFTLIGKKEEVVPQIMGSISLLLLND